MSTISTIQNTNYIQITILQKKLSTRITCPTEVVSSYVLLTWDAFHSKGVFLYCYRPPEHSVVLVRRVL